VTAQLRKGTRVVVAKTARLTAGTRLVALAVPRRAKAGFYTVRVAMRDLDGKTFGASRTVRIPR